MSTEVVDPPLEPRATTVPFTALQEMQAGMKKLPHVLNGLGFDELRPGQDTAVKTLMSQQDAVVILPTATGKSACFVIPTLCMGWRTIVVYPLIALIRDQVQSMQRKGMQAGAISSQESDAHNASVLRDWASGDLQFMLVSPERFANEEWANIVAQFPPDMVAMDECFTGDVELLTEDGFVRFDELEDGVKVAQVDPSTEVMTMVSPRKVIRRHHRGEIIHIQSTKGIDISVTPNHDLLMHRRNGTWRKRPAHEAKFNTLWHMKAAAGEGEGRDTLTPWERLQVAFQADGNAHSASSAAFSFVKARKIKRFLDLMHDGEFTFNEVKDNRPRRRRFIVTGVPGLSKTMRGSLDYNTLSARGCRLLADEAIMWDGSRISDTLGYYSSTVKSNTDYFQEVCIRGGLRTRITVQEDNRKDSYKDVHRLFIRLRTNKIDTQNFTRTSEPFSGMVYCVEVPTGCIVVRRSGKPVVIGNCHTFHEWADTFRHGYKICGKFIQKVTPKVVAAFSATLSDEAEEEVREGMGIQDAQLVYHYPRRKNLHLSSLHLENIAEAPAWVVENCEGPTVIYCSTHKNVEQSAEALQCYTDRPVYFYHGGMKPPDRKHQQDAFMDDPDAIIVATNAFGMGVDKANIRNVVHFDIPGTLVALAQECVHPDSMISTASGVKMATEVVSDEEMLDYRFEEGEYKPAMITEAIENQADKLIQIRTKLGSTMNVSPSHPVFVKEGGELAEVAASDVAVGDQLLGQLHLPPADPTPVDVMSLLLDCPEPVYVKVRPGLVDRLRMKLSPEEVSGHFRLSRPYDYNAYKSKKHGRLDYWLEACAAAGIGVAELRENITRFKTRSSRSISLPTNLTADLGWWLGIVATDGSVSRVESGGSKGYGSWRVRLGNTNRKIADKFASIAEALGVNAHRYTRPLSCSSSLSKKPMLKVECSHPLLVHLCNKAGIPSGKKSYTVSVAQWLRNADIPLRAGFVAGVIDGDGCLAKSKYQLRIHSAAWDFLSGVCMLMRGFGIPATCYAEDYTRKDVVMTASADHGYSLRVSSTEHYEKLRDIVSDYSCKAWQPVRRPNTGQDMTTQRRSRRKMTKLHGGEWLHDEILEASEVAYSGRVLNWRVEPGNQLVVDGILTHNCGRAGRDGEDSFCTIIPTAAGVKTRRFFIQCGNPTPADIRSFYEAAVSMQEGPGKPIMAKRDDIARKAGVSSWVVQAIMTFCLGEGIFGHDTDAARQQRVQFAEVIPSMTRIEMETRDALFDIALEKDDWWEFDISSLAEQIGFPEATAMSRLRRMADKGQLTWVKASTSKPLRVLKTMDQVDPAALARLQEKADQADADLQLVIDYANAMDEDKHTFLESHLNRKQ